MPSEVLEKINLLELKINLLELKVKPIEVTEAPEKIEDLELNKVNMLKVPNVIEEAEVEATETDNDSITTKMKQDVEERDNYMNQKNRKGKAQTHL